MNILSPEQAIRFTSIVEPSHFKVVGKVFSSEVLLSIAHWIDSVQKIERIWDHQDHDQALKNASLFTAHYLHLTKFNPDADKIFVIALRVLSLYLRILDVHDKMLRLIDCHLSFKKNLQNYSQVIHQSIYDKNSKLDTFSLLKGECTLILSYVINLIHHVASIIISTFSLYYSLSIPENYFRYQAILILTEFQLRISKNTATANSMIYQTGELFQMATKWIPSDNPQHIEEAIQNISIPNQLKSNKHYHQYNPHYTSSTDHFSNQNRYSHEVIY